MENLNQSQLVDLIQSEIKKYVQNIIVPIFIENNINYSKYIILPNIDINDINESINSDESTHSVHTKSVEENSKVDVNSKIIENSKIDVTKHIDTTKLDFDKHLVSWSKLCKDCANSNLIYFQHNDDILTDMNWEVCKMKYNIPKVTNKKYLEHLKENETNWSICYVKNTTHYSYIHSSTNPVQKEQNQKIQTTIVEQKSIQTDDLSISEFTKYYLDNVKTLNVKLCTKNGVDLCTSINKPKITIQAIYEKNYGKKIINTTKCIKELIDEWNKDTQSEYIIEVENKGLIGIEKVRYVKSRVETIVSNDTNSENQSLDGLTQNDDIISEDIQEFEKYLLSSTNQYSK